MKRSFCWIGILLIGILISLCLGRYGLDLDTTCLALLGHGDPLAVRVLYWIRLPRILFACVAGAALSICGLVYQTVFKNGLASPDLLGTTGGCSLGAIVGILWFSSSSWCSFLSFLGGIFSLFLVYFLSYRQKGNKILQLLICGMIVQAVFTSLIAGLKITADPYQELGTIEYWLMGGFSDVQWKQVLIGSSVVFLLLVVLYRMRWQVQMLSFGDEAKTLGVRVSYVRTIAFLMVVLLVSIVVSIAGPVSWVGLLVPHMVRLWTHRTMSENFLLTALIGAVFVLFCDTLARCLFPIELPISIVTSFFGALYLMVLFRKGKKIL